MKPVSVLKGNQLARERRNGMGLRKLLVVSQFVISVLLIIATLVVYRQLQFMQNKNLGLNKDHVVSTFHYNELAPQFESFRNELLSNPAIREVTRSSRLPSGRLLDSYGSAKVQMESDSLEPTKVDLKFITIDHRFAPTYELAVAAGQNYLQDQGGGSRSFMVNEAAVKMMGWKSATEAVGKKISYANREAEIGGVFRDFNFESLHQAVQPMIFFIPRDSTFFTFISVRLDGARVPEGLEHLKSVWQRTLPQYPFDYQFLEERYGQLYEAEQRQGRVFIGFAMLAILIACLGLFGLTAFIIQQRVKEIGIRKVLGASFAGLLGLLSLDFMKLVGIALVIAVPAGWYVMQHWLEDFAYRIAIGWQVFALAGIISIAVAFLTVGFQCARAALANPINSLRNE